MRSSDWSTLRDRRAWRASIPGSARPEAPALCARWTDPDFDPDERAAYYARVVETPSCRACVRACLNLSGQDRPSACDDADVPRTARERAWSSPIWFAPERGALQSADSR
ncbi:MAG: DUF3604 domain-containing protein [Myxococcota bacterium]